MCRRCWPALKLLCWYWTSGGPQAESLCINNNRPAFYSFPPEGASATNEQIIEKGQSITNLLKGHQDRKHVSLTGVCFSRVRHISSSFTENIWWGSVFNLITSDAGSSRFSSQRGENCLHGEFAATARLKQLCSLYFDLFLAPWRIDRITRSSQHLYHTPPLPRRMKTCLCSRVSRVG